MRFSTATTANPCSAEKRHLRGTIEPQKPLDRGGIVVYSCLQKGIVNAPLCKQYAEAITSVYPDLTLIVIAGMYQNAWRSALTRSARR